MSKKQKPDLSAPTKRKPISYEDVLKMFAGDKKRMARFVEGCRFAFSTGQPDDSEFIERYEKSAFYPAARTH